MLKDQVRIPLPTQGINLISDSLIANNEASEGTKNISFKNGIPQTRKGYVKANAFNFAAAEGKTLFHYKKDGAMIPLIAAGTKLYKKTNATTYTEITGALNSDYIHALNYAFSFGGADSYGDKCFILDGMSYRYFKDSGTLIDIPAYSQSSDETAKYGTNVLETTPDEIKKHRFIVNDNDRMWIGGYKNLVRISHLNRPGYFPSSQTWKLSEDCTGLVQFSDEVIMFTEHTATLIKGATLNWELPDTYIRRVLPVSFGCSQHRTIVIGNSALYWASVGGVFRYLQLPDGTYEPQCISEISNKNHTRTIKKLIDSVTDWTKTYAVFFDNEYRLCLGGNRWVIFDAISNTWAYFEYCNSFNHAVAYLGELFAIESYHYQLDYPYDGSVGTDGLSDDGQAIEFELGGKVFDLGKPANLKKFKKVFFTFFTELVSYNIDVTINLDNEYTQVTGEVINTVSRWGSFAFGDTINTKKTNLNYPIKINHKGKKYNFQYRLACNRLNEAFMLTDIVLLYKMKELG